MFVFRCLGSTMTRTLLKFDLYMRRTSRSSSLTGSSCLASPISFATGFGYTTSKASQFNHMSGFKGSCLPTGQIPFSSLQTTSKQITPC